MSLKARALFFLNRYVKDAEEKAEVDQEGMAKAGLSYAQRALLTEAADKSKNEAEALRWAYTKLSELSE